ncbi:DNA-processing protein DprA [Candidatus Gracilibacteria bacterium]|nr:DNA-processing protein DprA [Candidatus Gracilibacteria bacterium]
MYQEKFFNVTQKPLADIPDPPKKLFYQGDLDLIQLPAIAIVGTRHCSEYGEYVTQSLIKDLAALNIAIVSGLARGIDSIAHRTALEYGLKTIAVLGSGLNNIYPPENKNLAAEIAKKGLILSEYPADTTALPRNFPARNRIVSGLSIITVVIEAPSKSGALITANCALEQGREVFVVPGDIDRENSLGCIELLQKGGAYPISSAKDIIAFLNEAPTLLPQDLVKDKPRKKIQHYKLTLDEGTLLGLLSARRSTDIFQLQSQSGLEISTLLSTLTLLEMKGLVLAQADKYRSTI